MTDLGDLSVKLGAKGDTAQWLLLKHRRKKTHFRKSRLTSEEIKASEFVEGGKEYGIISESKEAIGKSRKAERVISS